MRAAVAALVLGGAGTALGATSWSLIDVGTLGGPGSYGAAISNSGVVAGCADTAAGPAHAFIFANGEMHDLGEPGSGQSCALAVNNDGVVAGRSDTGEIVIWRASGVTRLGVKGDVGGIKDLMKKSRELGMQTFDQSLFDLYEAGLITYEDALRNADSLNDLRLDIKLKGKEAKNRNMFSGIGNLDIVPETNE